MKRGIDLICTKCGFGMHQAAVVCPNCGALAPRTVEGFEYTLEVKEKLRELSENENCDIMADTKKFLSFLPEYLEDHEKERRLIKTIISDDQMREFFKDDNHNIAIMKAKDYMTTDLFLSNSACEFIMECVTYLLKWDYAYCADVSSGNKSASTDNSLGKKNKLGVDENDSRIFRSSSSFKYKFQSNIKINEGYTSIEGFCFDGFGFIKTVKLPSTIVSIGEYAFSDCKRLRQIELPESLRVIHKSAFSSCVSLSVIQIPYGVTSIEDGTFSFCHNLEVIDIPASVVSIGDEAFSGCESMQRIFIPESVKHIGENAFSLCPSIVVRCYQNSYTHKYCKNAGIQVEVLKKESFGRFNI